MTPDPSFRGVQPGLLLLLALLTAMPSPATADEATSVTVEVTSATTSADIPVSLRHEAQAALDRGYRWMLRRQGEDGSWSNPEFPALTALPVWALARGGHAGSPEVKRGVDFLLSCVHTNGSIYVEPTESRKGGGLSNYNTALAMVALHEVGRPDLDAPVHRARAYLAGSQHFGNDAYRGGMGYDPSTGRAYADLSNSYTAYEAMRLTERLKDLRDRGDDTDLDWDAALEFVGRVQNEDGGFIYRPGHSMAGSETNAAGEVSFRSYGSMTYAGLLSLVYAEVDQEDPRVKSAFAWATNHWTLEENPGMGQQGVYYFYHVLAKALAAHGQDVIRLPDGGKVNWRAELIAKLVGRQKVDPHTGDGYWVNEEGRWWEQDPVLVTSYALLALDIALAGGEG